MHRMFDFMRSARHRGGRRGVALALAFALLALLVPGLRGAGAEAPGLAVVRYDTPLLIAPESESGAIATLSAGDEVVLTGATAIDYVKVDANAGTGWVAADALSVSGRPGIPLAQAENGAPILAAPLPDATVLGEVPPGGVVMINGAQVGVYIAGSYNGIGGWIEEALLGLGFDDDSNAS